MNKELFRKTEGELYGYFEDIENLKRVRAEIVSLNISIENLDKRIRECNVSIDPEQNGCMQFTERVQTSTNCTSYVEREIAKAIGDMEREQAHKIRKLFKLECIERNLSYKVENMSRNIEMLKPEYKKFLELKYNQVKYKKLGMRDIALELNMGKNKAYDLREELVNDIARFNRNWGIK
ncbi:MAG: transcriptional regulator [Clostridium sp.]